MRILRKIPLLVWILVAILLGILVGWASQRTGSDVPVRIFATFGMVFSQLLGFAIPLIILGFIAPGIGSIGRGAGKLLGKAVALAYTSTILAGTMALLVALVLYPHILKGATVTAISDPSASLVKAYGVTVDANGVESLPFSLPPIMSVTTALILAFLLGLGMAGLSSTRMYDLAEDFRSIVEKFLSYIIIPLLPIYILSVFANMTYAGQVQHILKVFGKVFLMVIVLHWVFLVLVYCVAGATNRKSPFALLGHMMPAYLTALGTQSSAATIPVTLRSAKEAGVNSRIADFAIPLNANIHLAGSIITITSCSAAVVTMTHGRTPSFSSMIPLILVLGVMMVAAPGVPGGAVMTAVGALQSILGFNPTMIALMIALYLAQDSFGTATNVTGDGALAKILERMSRKQLAQPNVAEEMADARAAEDATALAQSDIAAAGLDAVSATSVAKKAEKGKKARQVAPTDSADEPTH
ncbi:dicarboxylate/amino acid:cation symporter [Lawsonella clevelandensis]|uniref:dicarboxylate/amino acid:cation symporter n=1 Tax=Lawsonella clevelandensis TaxID=1528099 RepID=UPI0009E66095|nr:dicarboxylate/amino acid:cation symporter [Lawsonella clevelandensis]